MEQEGVQQLLESNVETMVIIVSAILLLMVVTLITFFSIFQKRKTQLLIEKAEQKQKFDEEIVKSQTEIQEQTFQNISWELHDNIGQLLSVARMQLNMLHPDVSEENQKRLEETVEVVAKSLQEVRALSKSLNTDFIKNIGLYKALRNELQRFNKLNFLEANIEVIGNEVAIDPKEEIIIFRILQEFFSNVIKHSKASELSVKLLYKEDSLEITAKDDGVGFDFNNVVEGTGLINMRSRAQLINAVLAIDAAPNQGVLLTLHYPTNKPTD